MATVWPVVWCFVYLSNRDLLRAVHQWCAENYPRRTPTRLTIQFADGERIGLLVDVAGDTPVIRNGQAGRRHSPDFCSVMYDGRLFVLTSNQAAIVKALWEANENGTPCVQGATLLEAADCESSRLSDVFRGSEAWGVLVVDGLVKGTYRLAERISGEERP